MAEPLDAWMTVSEAAAEKGVATSAVRLAILTGRVNGQKKGKSWLVRRDDVKRWEPQRRPRKGT